MYDEKKKFKICIKYREPSFELRIGQQDSPYTCTYSINAVNADSAKKLAVEEFQKTAKISSVGWAREIVSVEVVWD